MTLRLRTVCRNVRGLLLLSLVSIGLMEDYPSPEQMLVGVRYGDQVLVPSNQLLSPFGRRVEFPGWPVDIAFSPQSNLLAVLVHDRIEVFSPAGQRLRTLRASPASYMGLAFTPDGQWVVASVLPVDGNHAVAIADVHGRTGTAFMFVPRNSIPAGLAFDRTGANLYVALNGLNKVGRLEIGLGRVVATVDVGVAPVGLAITPDGSRLFVTNWGGRFAAAGEPTALSFRTPTLIDERGVASSGTVSVIDVPSFQVIAEIPVGLHPGGIQISPDGRLAAITNANSDSVTFVDTSSLEVVETVSLPAFPEGFLGSSPTSLAFSPTGQRLYATCSGNNAVALLEREYPAYRLRGFIPTDWYPVAVATGVSQDGGETVFVANAKGIGSRNATREHRVTQVMGTLTIFPGGEATESQTETVALANNPFRNAALPSNSPENLAKLGIEHVFLIIKENRTYDQVLGDLDRGNGDPSLTLYGWAVTPNQHELARQFVTLDNFYVSGVRSADGHQWLTQAMVTDYMERGFGTLPRSYPFWGDDPMAFAPSGFLWNNAQKAGRTARVFGEFTVPVIGTSRRWTEYFRDAQSPEMKLSTLSYSPVASLNAFVETSFPGYAMNIPDVFRARIFLEKFREFEEQRSLPNLIILLLPTDHTAGRSPNFPTPRAMVADNDLALGRIVEAITRSSYWPRSAIFVTEDDAQDGVDHVDGHRTLCFVISPFARRNVLDSTHYNQTSILRTIEELLGLPAMNKFDAAALPMRSVFTTEPDLRPFLAVLNRILLDEMNPSPAGLTGNERQAVVESMAMNFSRPDAAPEETLNRILWHTERGWLKPYPHVPHRWNCPKDKD